MGFLFERYGMSLVDIPTTGGKCPECGMLHDKWAPHNRDSLQYMYRFYDKHGYWPSWHDAMTHCDKETQNAWAKELRARNIDINTRPDKLNAQLAIIKE